MTKEKETIEAPQPKMLKQFFMVFLSGATKPIQLSEEIVQFIEGFAGSEVNDKLQRIFYINSIRFVIDVKYVKEVAPPTPLKKV